MADVKISTAKNPDEIVVQAPIIKLNTVDYSILEYDQFVRATLEFIRDRHSDQFNDWVKNNGIIMLIEAFSYMAHLLSARADVLANEAYLPTCFTNDTLNKILVLINQQMLRATPASTEMELSMRVPSSTDVRIPAPINVRCKGANGEPINYEVYASPDDMISDIIIPMNKYGVIAYGVEGSFKDPYTINSTGAVNQTIEVIDDNIISAPIYIKVGDQLWSEVYNLEQYGAHDKVYVKRHYEKSMKVSFGDGEHGAVPPAGLVIEIRYRTGGGVKGRISAYAINTQISVSPQPPATAPVQVRIRNTSPSTGGYDEESLADAKVRAPKVAATHSMANSASDYVNLAINYSHPVYGKVLKASASMTTDMTVDDRTFTSANIIQAYVLAEGADGSPVAPSSGLKLGLKNYLEDLNPITDEVQVVDGAKYPIDLDIVITLHKGSNSAVVTKDIENVIDNFFSITQFAMGQGLYLSNLYKAIQDVDGVVNVSIRNPIDDIIPSKMIGPNSDGTIGVNELLVLASKQLQFYYAQ